MDAFDVIIEALVLGVPAAFLVGEVLFAWWLHRAVRHRPLDTEGPLGSRERVGSSR